MQFSSALLVAATLGFANAVTVFFTNSAFNGITAGQPITLTWTNATGPVTILLKNGPEKKLNTVSPIASGLSGGSFVWNVPATLPKDTYALEISDSGPEPNYSSRFELIGGAAASSTASSALSSVTSSASSVVSSVRSSVSSVVSSITANSTTSAPTSSTTGASSNGTTTGSNASTTKGSTPSKTNTAGSSTTTAVVPNANGAADIASPLALVFLTFAAVLSLN